MEIILTAQSRMSATKKSWTGCRAGASWGPTHGFTCRYCGGKAPDAVVQKDHIVAKSKGRLLDKFSAMPLNALIAVLLTGTSALLEESIYEMAVSISS